MFFFLFKILKKCRFQRYITLNVEVNCGDHAPLYNLFNVILKNLGMFNVNSFCHLHSFFARCFYSFVEFFVLRKQKRNKLPTTTTKQLSNDLQTNLRYIIMINYDYDSFRAATLRTFFFRFSRGSKRVKLIFPKKTMHAVSR